MTVANWMLGAVLAAAMPVAAIAAPAPPAPSQAPLPDNAKAVGEVRALIARNYVLPEMRGPLDAVLARGLAAGRYTNIDPMELSNRLTGDMAAVAHDKHLYIHFSPDEAKSLATAEPEDASDVYFGREGFWAKVARDNNQGVIKLEVLDGNIRTLNYRAFFWAGEPTKAAIDRAMAFLRGGDAIIIDLRNNGGGSPEAVRYLASYFVPAGTKLVTFYLKQDPPTTSVAEAVPGGVIAGKPVYVLTSGHTASAAEEFSSHVAGFGFGKLVGETTAGAAYRNDTYPVAGAYVLSLSIGRPELPKGGNWEEKGVAPAIAIAQDKALNAAQGDALAMLAASAAPADRTELSWLGLAAKARGADPLPAATMAGYVGKFGGVRSVTVANDQLHYRREGGIETTMLPIGPDLFTLDADPRTHLRFVRKDGAITGLEFLHLDGTSNIVAKD